MRRLLSKSLTIPVLFLTSSALFLGGMLFLTKKNSHHITYTKQEIGISKELSNHLQKWGMDFFEKDGVLSINNIKNSHYAKFIGLKNGDKIIKINSLYMPSKKEFLNFLQQADTSRIINIVVKRGDNLYNFKVLPSF